MKEIDWEGLCAQCGLRCYGKCGEGVVVARKKQVADVDLMQYLEAKIRELDKCVSILEVKERNR